jgi:RNA polymerase-binding transcription factor DksA
MKTTNVNAASDLSSIDLARIRRTLLAMRAELVASPGDRSRLRLGQVESALQRMAHGRFGTCEACGGTVVKARLLATPYARYCAPCSNGAGGRPQGARTIDAAASMAASSSLTRALRSAPL